MKLRFLTFVWGAFLSFCLPVAAEVLPHSVQPCPAVDIQQCGDGIFHVRIYSGQQPQEALLERYGIIKTDWPECQNPSYSVEPCQISDAAGCSLRVKDIAGEQVIESISYYGPGSEIVQQMNADIKRRFVGIKAQAVLGDNSLVNVQSDDSEGGDPSCGSIISIKLRDGERFYGGGSTSREHINHRGEYLRMHTTYQVSEIPMPFMMSSNGWGIFNNTTYKHYWDIGATNPDELRIYTPCQDADFYIFIAPSMPQMLDLYTQLTGRTYVLPKWAYGFCFGPHEREDQWDILSDAVNFRASDVPCDVIWLEPQWMAKHYDFTTAKKVNSKMFDFEPYWKVDTYPKTMANRLFVGKLRNMGYHLGLWLCEDYDLSLVEEDWIAQRQGKPVSGQEHWMDHLGTFMDLGVEGFKLDPARTINEHPVRQYYNGLTDLQMHNLDQVLLGKQMKEFTRRHTGKRSWHHYCAGWSGSQAYSAANSGDNGGGKTALFDQLNLGMSGFMNLTCDIMNVGAEQEMQSLHFGTFLPWCQVNSWFSMMQPFFYNDFQQTLYRNCIQLRYSLIPYIYSNALEGFLTGMPMTRPMPLIFPDDRNCDDMWDQFMCGPNLLVGVFTDTVYLPEGTWFDAWTGRKIESRGQQCNLPYPEDRAGLLFVKGGAIIPCLAHKGKYLGTEPISDYKIKVYPVTNSRGASSCSNYVLRDSDSQSYGYEEGLIAERTISCEVSAKTVTIVVNPVQGGFENMPQITNMEFEVRLDKKPRSVTIDGRRVKSWSYSSFGEDITGGTLSIAPQSLLPSDCLQVEIRY